MSVLKLCLYGLRKTPFKSGGEFNYGKGSQENQTS